MQESQASQPEVAPINPRSQDEINNEYAQVCAHIGDRCHKIKILEAEVLVLGNRLNALDAENRALAQQKAAISAHNKKVEADRLAKKEGLKSVPSESNESVVAS